MSRDRLDIAREAETPVAVEGVYPIARHASKDDVVAVRAQQPIDRTRFLRDIASLATQLPAHKYVLNLCTDRYRFMVGFAAALCRQQISLLAPSDAPGVLKTLAADYPDLYALTDTLRPPFPSVVYPDRFEDDGALPDVPLLPGGQPALVLFTSGSTGRPKAVSKSWGTLVRSAQAAGDRLGIPQLGRVTLIGTVPHQHSYGLESMILLGLQHGLIVDAARPLYPGDIRAAIEAASRPRVLVTTPVHLRALMADPDGLSPVDLVLSATAPLSTDLAARAEDCFRAPVVEIYGCTEAGQIATRRCVRELRWQCLDGVRLSQDARGTWADGPSVQSTVLLHDTIEMTGPAEFLLGDRSADLVNVAGKRTSLAHLNHLLLGIEGVKDGTFFMPESDSRHIVRLMAVAVAPGLRPEAVLRALRERIDAAFLPRPLVLVNELPRNALGKLPRETLLQLVSRNRGA